MRNIITLLLTVVSLTVYGQADLTRTKPVGQTPSQTATYNKSAVVDANLKAKLNLSIPRAVTFTLNNARDTAGYIMYNTTIQRMGIYKGNGKWDTLASTLDTVSLSNRIDLKADRLNGLVSSGGITLVGSNVTVASPIIWWINGVTYTKATNSVFTINAATDGFYRKDLIYATSSSTILKIQGTENTGLAVEPNLPAGSIKITVVDVFGAAIEQPIPLIGDYQPLENQRLSTNNNVEFHDVKVNAVLEANQGVVQGLTAIQGISTKLIDINRFSTNSANSVRWQTNAVNDWSLGSSPTGDTTHNLSLYNYSTASEALTVSKTTNRVSVKETPVDSNDVVRLGDLALKADDKPNSLGLISGNSTIAAYLGQSSIASFLLKPQDITLGATVVDISVAGHTILQQHNAYLALSNKSDFDYHTIEIGLNDLTQAELVTTTISRLQNYINSINTYKKAGSKIILCALTPCKGIFQGYGEVLSETYYQRWVAINEAIMGGANAITGVDARIDAHSIALNDGEGNLAPPYNIDNLHENNAGRQIIADVYRNQLNQFGFLKTSPASTVTPYVLGGLKSTGKIYTPSGITSGSIKISDGTDVGGVLSFGDVNSGLNYNGFYRGGFGTLGSGNALNIAGYDGINFSVGSSTFGNNPSLMRITNGGTSFKYGWSNYFYTGSPSNDYYALSANNNPLDGLSADNTRTSAAMTMYTTPSWSAISLRTNTIPNVTGIESFYLHPSGNLTLQRGGSFVDDGVNKLQVDGSIKATSFIKSGGTSSQFLKADGSVDGSTYLTTSSAPVQLFDNYTTVGNTGTAETDLVSYTIPINKLGNNGEKIIAKYGGNTDVSTGVNRSLRVSFGGNILFDTTPTASLVNKKWVLNVFIIRVSNSVIRYNVSASLSDGSFTTSVSEGELTGLTLNTNTYVLKVTGLTNGVTDQIMCTTGSGEWKPAAL